MADGASPTQRRSRTPAPPQDGSSGRGGNGGDGSFGGGLIIKDAQNPNPSYSGLVGRDFKGWDGLSLWA
jgi:hypothetical protein